MPSTFFYRPLITLFLLVASVFGGSSVYAAESFIPARLMQELQSKSCPAGTFAQGYTLSGSNYELKCISILDIQANLGAVEGGILGCPSGQIAIGASADRKMLRCQAILKDPCPLTEQEITDINALRVGTKLTKDQICKLEEVYIGNLANAYSYYYNPNVNENNQAYVSNPGTSWVTSTSITNLSTGFGKIPTLRTFIISNASNLRAIPEGLGSRPNLETFIINNSPNLTAIPQSLGNSKYLKTFKLISTGVRAIPESFGANTESLEEVLVSSNPYLSSLGNNFGDLPVLKYLEITNNKQLTSLPTNFGNLGDTLEGTMSYPTSATQYNY